MKHTKEPWEVGELIIKNIIGDDDVIVTCLKTETGNNETNAKRIVACVNACADVEDDCLEQGYVKWLQQRIVELELSVMNLEEEIARLEVIDNCLVTNGEWEEV